ncbi:MAG TPA: RsmG family class I SAM-dependent methyltransferase [Polyangiaceae bacterium]
MLGKGWTPRLETVAHALLPTDETDLSARFARALPSLCRYLDLLVEWNQRFDLTAARSEDELVDLALADALVIVEGSLTGQQPPAGEAWVDVGSGAGAPALPLALLLPEIALTMVEPKSKRVAFLRTASGALSLHVSVSRARSAELEPASHAVALSRATLAPDLWLPEGARLATKAVWVLLARGELPRLDGWQVAGDWEYQWPLTGVERRALRFERV